MTNVMSPAAMTANSCQRGMLVLLRERPLCAVFCRKSPFQAQIIPTPNCCGSGRSLAGGKEKALTVVSRSGLYSTAR